MREDSRFIIGIDLGTTNSSVSFIDIHEAKKRVSLLRIPQLNGSGFIEPLQMLPSFHYLLDEQEMPGKEFIVGAWAQAQGKRVPTKVVRSAKSWLSNAASKRKEKILPFEAFDDERKISPVEAVSSYLSHICKAWKETIAKEDVSLELEQQEVIITVPASFDEVARRLTIEAANLAGIRRLTLLEEPQAAFYNWLREHENAHHFFSSGDTILVCDIGGGTTDFSLIDVRVSNGQFEFQRMAVGPHLLLGGDNMDMALAHFVENRLNGTFSSQEWLLLLHEAKKAKEFLLSGQNRYSLLVSKPGAKVIGGSAKLELAREEIQSILMEGFFGLYDFNEAIQIKRELAIRTMGLGFEQEPSVTKHLAHFLSKSGKKEKPTYILFNGGAMKPSCFKERIIQSLDRWFPNTLPIKVLQEESLDIAVSKGAAYFGKARRGEGIRITAGLARNYYLKVNIENQSPRALTLLTRGALENVEFEVPSLFSLLPNTPVSFELFHSHTRLEDKRGVLVEIVEEEMAALPPLHTVLQYGKESREPLSVRLKCHLTELGIFELFLVSEKTNHNWKLEFQLSDGEHSTKRLSDETCDESFSEQACLEIREAFAVGEQERLQGIMPSLEKILQKPKNEWSISSLRRLFDTLIEQQDKRHLAVNYETKFWNLAGFLMRPGFGSPLDEYRIKQLWKLILTDFQRKQNEEAEIQKWIACRRFSGGLKKGQQHQLFNELFPLLYNPKKKVLLAPEKKKRYPYEERLRAAASFEYIENSAKIKLGDALLQRILSGKAFPSEYWALARIGARTLFYGDISQVIPASICEKWAFSLLECPFADPQHLTFVLSLFVAETDARVIALSSKCLEAIKEYLAKQGQEILAIKELFQQQERIFGDALPPGLTLTNDEFLPRIE